MKKIDTRGFVMVETIIVAVFVIGICTFLFANFLPLIGDYERIEHYDSPSSKYKVHEIRKMILRDLANNPNIESIFTELPSTSWHMYRTFTTVQGDSTISQNRLCDFLDAHNYCNQLLGEHYLNVKAIVITPFKLNIVKKTIKETKDYRELKEYIDYLPSYSNYSSRYDDYYRLIVVFNDGEIATIEVHYEIG